MSVTKNVRVPLGNGGLEASVRLMEGMVVRFGTARHPEVDDHPCECSAKKSVSRVNTTLTWDGRDAAERPFPDRAAGSNGSKLRPSTRFKSLSVRLDGR
jgi:hypothetical protein